MQKIKLLDKWEKAGRILAWPLWLVLLATIPITSSPIIASFSGGETPVSPLSIIPLSVIVLLWLIPYLIRGGSLPAASWPILAFFLLSLMSGLFSIRLPILPYKDATQLERGIRALLTLGIGISFYLTALKLPSDKQRVIMSLRALYVGLVILLVWSSVQAVIMLDRSDRMPLVVTQIHHIFSVRDPLPDRVTGMAFEPSWLGDQLVVLYIPLLLGSVITRWSVFRTKWGWFSAELILLLCSAFMLILTRSRLSLLSLLIFGVLAYFYLGFISLQKLVQKTGISRFQKRSINWLPNMLGFLIFVAILAGLLLGSGWLLSRFDPRLNQLFSAPTRYAEFEYFYPREAHYEIADNLAFAERLVYWSFGFRTFSQHPIIGVGPGNAGFFFEKNIPAYGYELTEIRNVLYTQDYGFPNPKNLWLRVLSETGMIGFSFYAIWYLLIGLNSVLLWKTGEDVYRMIGFAGVVLFVTQIIEGFSIDTYALPQIWVSFGLIAASAQQVKLSPKGEADPL